jgi:signal transduction histidine kinase/ligand-binding sensor domain-containing protein
MSVLLHRFRFALLFGLLVIVAPPLAAQELPLRFDHLTVNDGLSQASVTAIAQDTTGYVWIGTDDGLNRFDGYSFTVFAHDDADSTSLPHSSIEDLAVDSHGRLWVGTYGGGLARFLPQSQSFRRYRVDSSLVAQRVTAVHPGARGTVWVGTEGAGLHRFDPSTGTMTAYHHDPDDPHSLSHDVIRDLAQGPDGSLWIATHGGGVNRWHPDTETFAAWGRAPNARHSLASDSVEAVIADRDGTVWVGTATGLTRWTPLPLSRTSERSEESPPWGTTTTVRHRPGDPTSLPPGRIEALLHDREGRLWIATEGGGLAYRAGDTGGFVRLTAEPHSSLGTDRFRSLFLDESGLLWAGAWGDGLYKQRRTQFAVARHRPNAPPSASPPPDLAAFAEAPNGDLWIASFESGITRYASHTGRYTHYTAASGLPSDLTRAVAVDTGGRIWVGTRNYGAGRLDPSTGRFTPVPRLPPNGRTEPLGSIISFHRDDRGTLWAASYGSGPCRYDPGVDRFRCLRDRWPNLDLSNSNVYAVYRDAHNHLWTSVWGAGVDRIDLDTGHVVHYRHRMDDPTSLSHNSVTHIGATRDGTLFVSTYGGGLNRFDPDTETFHRFTERDGLPSDVVYGVLEDRQGDLWMSTNQGLARYARDTETVTAFGPEDGLQAAEFNGHSLLRLDSSEMVFGGLNGYNRFDPSHIRPRSYAPPVVITHVEVAGKPYPFHSALYTHYPLRLHHQQNFIDFEFAALDYNAPAANRYEYRLEGVDDGWIDANGRRYAAYTDLEPDTYVFRVRGSNSDRIVSPKEAQLTVTIVPPFWQTEWFQFLVGLGLLTGSIAVVYHLSTRRLRREVRELETKRHLQEERERISRDLHDHVGAQLSNIKSGLELVRLAAQAGQPERARAHLHNLDDDVDLTMSQLRDTIWALHGESLSLAELGHQVERFLERQTRYRNRPDVSCSCAPRSDVTLSPVQALHVFRIIQEGVNNALKHADADTLSVRLNETDDNDIEIVVRDDGIGLQCLPQGSSRGYGLPNLQKRAEELGGEAVIESDASTGTTIRVTIRVESSPPT